MAKKSLTADTSVVVPAVCGWHEAHAAAAEAAAGVTCLPAHVLIEAVATLTRLPHGFAVRAALAADVLRQRFPEPPMTLDARGHLRLMEIIKREGIRGGQVYDALVGATASTTSAVLLSRDRRAEATYRAVGARVSLLT